MLCFSYAAFAAAVTLAPMLSETADCNENFGSVDGVESSEYRGCQTLTHTGHTCQKWTEQSPHGHNNTPASKPGKGLGNHNFCRNPDGELTIWCYTTLKVPRWEFCIPIVEMPNCSGYIWPNHTILSLQTMQNGLYYSVMGSPLVGAEVTDEQFALAATLMPSKEVAVKSKWVECVTTVMSSPTGMPTSTPTPIPAPVPTPAGMPTSPDAVKDEQPSPMPTPTPGALEADSGQVARWNLATLYIVVVILLQHMGAIDHACLSM